MPIASRPRVTASSPMEYSPVPAGTPLSRRHEGLEPVLHLREYVVLRRCVGHGGLPGGELGRAGDADQDAVLGRRTISPEAPPTASLMGPLSPGPVTAASTHLGGRSSGQEIGKGGGGLESEFTLKQVLGAVVPVEGVGNVALGQVHRDEHRVRGLAEGPRGPPPARGGGLGRGGGAGSETSRRARERAVAAC